MARVTQQGKPQTGTWDVSIRSGTGAGAQTRIEGSKLVLGSTEDDDVVLPGKLGPARVAFTLQGRQVLITANREAVTVNGRPVLPGLEMPVTLPALVSFGVLEVEVALVDPAGRAVSGGAGVLGRLSGIVSGPGNPDQAGQKAGSLRPWLLPVLGLALLCALGFVVWQGVNQVSSAVPGGLAGFGSKADRGSANRSAQDQSALQAGGLQAINQQLAALGLSDALVATQTDGSLTITGRLTREEAGPWQDVEPALQAMAAPQKLLTAVTVEPAEVEAAPQPRTRVRAPSMGTTVAALDFSTGTIVLEGGGTVATGGTLPNGWRLVGMSSHGITVSKDGASIQLGLEDLMQ
jgi:hypothetical protein